MVAEARRHAGDGYGGDQDAPRVEIISEPQLGASMDLPATHSEVWPILSATAQLLAPRCTVYGIACNTLNVYADALRELPLEAELVSVTDAVASWAAVQGVTRLTLLGARPVAEMGEWSPYRTLTDHVEVDAPDDIDGLHQLIVDIKVAGSTPELEDRLATFVAASPAPTVVLGCTELPLLATDRLRAAVPDHALVDATDLLAAELVRRWSVTGAG